MTTESEFRALLERCLPVKSSLGELSLVAGEHSVYVFDSGLTARLQWQRARPEGYPYDLSPHEASVEFRRPGRAGSPLSPSQIEALFRAMSALLPLVARDDPSWFESRSHPGDFFPRAVLAKKSLETQEQFHRALADAYGVGSLLLTSEERSNWLSLEEVDAIVRECFPVRGGRFELALGNASSYYGDKAAGAAVDQKGHVSLVIQILIYDGPDEKGEMMIRDIKEQEVYTLPADRRADRERFTAFVQGLTDGLRARFEARPDDERMDYSMPCDLWDTSLFALKRARTRDDYFQAYRKRQKL
jgi:hypothetical protein